MMAMTDRPNYAYWQSAGAYWTTEYERRRLEQPYYLLQELAWLAIFTAAAPASVLELGCGVGRHLRYLRDVPGINVHGADQSPTMLEGVRSWADADWAERHLTLVEPTGRLPFDDDQFDFVFSCEALIHVHPDDLAGRLTEMHRVARRAVLHIEPASGVLIHETAHDGSWCHDLVAAWATLGREAEAVGNVCTTQHLVITAKAGERLDDAYLKQVLGRLVHLEPRPG
jgi:SAM-dependent methyltransferase